MYGTNQPKLIDVRAPLSIDAKAMQFFNAQNSTNKIANQAILAGKNTTEEILRVFIGMHSEETPFRIFTDYETAVNWLNFKNR